MNICRRLFAKNILCVGSEIGRLPPQFGDASKIASAIMTSGFEFDHGRLFYNQFKWVNKFWLKAIPTLIYNLFWPSLGLLSPTKPRKFQSIQMELWTLLTSCLCTIPSILTLSNLTWNILWHQWSTMLWKREHALSNPPGWLPWTTQARTPVIWFLNLFCQVP